MSDEHWVGKRDLLASGMEFGNTVLSTVQETILSMVADGCPTRAGQFRTPGGRDAVVVVSVDPDNVRDLLDEYGNGDDTHGE